MSMTIEEKMDKLEQRVLMDAVWMTYLLVRMAVAFVKWARQRRQ